MKTRYSMGSCLVVGMLCAVSPWWGHFFPTSAAGDDRLSWQAERVTVGAIRWDAWFSDPHNPYVKNLSAHKWHHRLPFYAEIISDSEVRIQNDVQEVVDREIAYARQGGIDYWAFLYYQPTVRKDGFDHDAMNRARRLFLSSLDRNWFGCDQLLHRLGRAGLCRHTSRPPEALGWPEGYREESDSEPERRLGRAP